MILSTAKPKSKHPPGKPFPWACPRCLKREVRPKTTNYAIEIRHDERLYKVRVPRLEIPTCERCGERVFSNAADDQISHALRMQLRLLQPEQIRAALRGLGMRQKELAKRLGVAEATVSGWVQGLLIQSRAMDNLLRLYFGLPEVRAVLVGAKQDPSLGVSAVR